MASEHYLPSDRWCEFADYRTKSFAGRVKMFDGKTLAADFTASKTEGTPSLPTTLFQQPAQAKWRPWCSSPDAGAAQSRGHFAWSHWRGWGMAQHLCSTIGRAKPRCGSSRIPKKRTLETIVLQSDSDSGRDGFPEINRSLPHQRSSREMTNMQGADIKLGTGLVRDGLGGDEI